jgi:pimeloyl-ACP methyl ester carboxylesterase
MNEKLPVLQRLAGITQTRQIPNAAHFPMIENSNAFYCAILDFVNAASQVA